MNCLDLERLKEYEGKEAFLKKLRQRAFESEMNYHGCAQVMVDTFLALVGHECEGVTMAASPFSAGLALTGKSCGALLGGLMVLGLTFGRRRLEEGMEGILRGIRPMRKLVKFFEGRYGSGDCRDITKANLADPEEAKAFFSSGGLERCATLIGDTAVFIGELLYDEFEKREKEK